MGSLCAIDAAVDNLRGLTCRVFGDYNTAKIQLTVEGVAYLRDRLESTVNFP